MSKILILGDIHGRLIWNDIIEKENPGKVIFLGDYVSTHEGISPEQQLSNLEDILNYKEDNSDKVILLRGNHDNQFLGYTWAKCSGFDRVVSKGMIAIKERFLNTTQWIHIENDIIFSHAGISQVWLDIQGIKSIDSINDEPPSEKFAFNGGTWDMTGTSSTQPCTWIRPQTLIECAVKGYTQVVGHTPVKYIFNIKDQIKDSENIWLCDALGIGQYLIIDNGDFIVKSLND